MTQRLQPDADEPTDRADLLARDLGDLLVAALAEQPEHEHFALVDGPGAARRVPDPESRPDRRDVKAYVTAVEETLIRTLGALAIPAARSPRKDRVTSVWVGNDKIAAIGVHISRWITTHGFALNVTNEPLAHFSGIVPCGITDGGVTSIERVLGRAPSLTEVAAALLPFFADVFGREIIER